ncbi:MAG: DNA polymerase ligase N-terminal domain-containing protein [Patescibacteria group bacterium]
MGFKEYKKKRDFKKTSEPKPVVKGKTQSRFVIQEHYARNLHYDFRLEMADEKGKEVVLKSWAVPKNIPVKVGVKRLAIQTEDHPIEYINFSGIVPEGNYGAGVVNIWDKGRWELMDGILAEGRLIFKLKGSKTKGDYVMIKTRSCGGKANNKLNWLIWKK